MNLGQADQPQLILCSTQLGTCHAQLHLTALQLGIADHIGRDQRLRAFDGALGQLGGRQRAQEGELRVG